MQSNIAKNKRTRSLFSHLNTYVALVLSGVLKACQSIVNSAEKSVKRERVNFQEWAEKIIERQLIKVKEIIDTQRVDFQDTIKTIIDTQRVNLEETAKEIIVDRESKTEGYINDIKTNIDNLVNTIKNSTKLIDDRTSKKFTNKVNSAKNRYSIINQEVKECAKKVFDNSTNHEDGSVKINSDVFSSSIRVASYIPFIIDLLIKYNKEIIEYFKKDSSNPYQECINIQILSLLLNNQEKLQKTLREDKYKKYKRVDEIIINLKDPSKLLVDELKSIEDCIKIIFYITHNILELDENKEDHKSVNSRDTNIAVFGNKYQDHLAELEKLIDYANQCKAIDITNKSVDDYIQGIEEVECKLFDEVVPGGCFESYSKVHLDFPE